jgi:hypothetical protein
MFPEKKGREMFFYQVSIIYATSMFEEATDVCPRIFFSPQNIHKPIKIDYILCICSHKSLSRWPFLSLSEFSEIKIMTYSLALNFYCVIDINIYLIFVLVSCKHITTTLLIHSHEFSYSFQSLATASSAR